MKKLLLFLLFSQISWGNPQGAAVNSGTVQITEMGSLLEINASHRSVIDWHSFSIERGETARFVLPSAESAVLNRVTGSEMSRLMGLLESNGVVYLANPNGIVVGKEGQISAAAFYGSSLELNVGDFLEGNSIHFSKDPIGTITNLGEIRALTGSVTLLSRKVENEGLIEAKNGSVNLFSGHEILVDPTGDALLFIRTAIDGEGIDVKGTIDALQVRMEAQGPYGIAIGLGDSLDASVIVKENGKIYLAAHDGVLKIDQNSSIVAPGGEITLLGNQVEIPDALINASGNEGGGVIRIGGDYPAIDRLRPLAETTLIGKKARIKADALLNGDGGDIVVWSEERTQCEGFLTAQALSGSGNGGFIEVSAKNHLVMKGKVDLRAHSGRTGTLLLDPNTVTINSAGPTAGGSFSACVPPRTFTPSGGDDVILDTDLETYLNTCNVTINSNAEIILDSCIIVPATQSLLTLNAGTSITSSVFGATINTPLTMTAGTNITLDQSFTNHSSSSTISTTWTATVGSITIANGGSVRTTGPVTLTLSASDSISATGGLTVVDFTSSYAGATPFTAFSFNATGTTAGTYSGIDLNYAAVTTSRGSVSMTGQGGNTGSSCRGVALTNCSVTTGAGNITIAGTGGGGAAGTGNVGVYLRNYLSDITSTSGTISITGTGGAGTTGSIGIQLSHSGVPANALNITGASTITLSGAGGGTSTGNDGIQIGTLCNITASGSGSISLTGTASGTSRNGINVAGGSITGVNGNITFTGTGTSGNGIAVQTTGSTVQTTGSGSISFSSSAGNILVGYDGTGSGNALVTATGTGGITMTAADSLSVIGAAVAQNGTISITAGAGNILLLAGSNLSLSSNSGGVPTISNGGTGGITLVADNSFPSTGSGSGQFNVSSGAVLTTSSGELRIYTVQSSQNTISTSSINSLAYPTSSHEVSGVYYPSGSYVSPGYTIFYKIGSSSSSTVIPPAVLAEAVVAIVQPVAEPAQIAEQTTITNQQPTSTPDNKKGCRSPSVAIQAL